jgi:peptidoglycan/LPS O-acetylase OafA/YrhL
MSRRLPAIDGLRGVAMLAVLIQHLFGKPYDWMALHVGSITVFPFPFLSNGFHALGLFFMLSGFVLYLPYAQGKRSMRSAADATRYFTHRLLRLLPLLIVSSLIITFGYHIGTGSPLIADALTTLRQAIWYEADYPLHNGVLWSLRTELWFCIFFPAIVLIGSRFGMRRTALIFCVFALSIKMLGVFLTPALGPKLLNDSILGRIDDFALGMLLAELFVVSPEKLRSRWALVGSTLLLLIAFQITNLSRSGLITPYAGPFTYLLASIAFTCIIARVLTGEGSRFNRLLSLRPLTSIGMTSYSIYIWHVPLMRLLSPWGSALNFVTYILLLLAVSRISYLLLERPFLRSRTKKLSLMPAPVPLPS